jgi:hypothetical protein
MDDHVDNGSPATRASVQSVARDVRKLGTDLRDLHNALVGVPGISKGVLAELREDNKELHDQWVAFQANFPEAINAAVVQADNKRARVIVTGIRSWWVAVASSVVAGLVVATLIYVFHIGLTVAR